jgi:exodeoxyribonuclease VII large subunit
MARWRKVDQVQPGDALQARVGDGVIDVQVK